jgi:hypothetical protein
VDTAVLVRDGRSFNSFIRSINRTSNKKGESNVISTRWWVRRAAGNVHGDLRGL